jgi:uncharacterized membrane protein
MIDPVEDSKNWRYGIFYINPDDQRIIVPKRIRWMGLTLNFAHAASWIISGSMILMITILARYAD